MRLLGPLADWVAQSASLRHTGHRPWPVPSRPWIMGQTWRRLLFAHWRVPLEALRPTVPAGLPLDTFEGGAWLAITPFRITGLRPHGAPPPPLLSRFPELNVRTYVAVDGVPGIWFLSLDAGSRVAVAAARRGYRLPYFHARVDLDSEGGTVGYASRRLSAEGSPARFRIRYWPTGPVVDYPDRSLERWLTERYSLYTLDDRRRVLRADIHHAPWALQPAEAVVDTNTMADAHGIALRRQPELLHYAERQDVVFWPPVPIGSSRTEPAAK
jgi:uncharacterized protein YqjF (DUF2071 family)